MLFKQKDLLLIKTGKTTLAFRKWSKGSVANGATHLTAVGQIRILEIKEISIEEITHSDALNAGYSDQSKLISSLNSQTGEKLFKIELEFLGDDPRIKLRSSTDINEDDLNEVKKKLDRLDKYSKSGSWTKKTLQLIQKYPKIRSADIYHLVSLDQKPFKLNVRKLKNMGLTISHGVGYSLSPRGKIILEFLTNKA